MVLGGVGLLFVGFFVCDTVNESALTLVVLTMLLLKVLVWEVEVEASGLVSVDLWGGCLLLLSVFIGACMVLGNGHVNQEPFLLKLIGGTMVVLVLAFSVSNWICFLVLFEATVIPVLVMVLGWGFQPERLQAVYYLVVYTVGSGVPLVYGLSLVYNEGSSLTILSGSNSLSVAVWHPLVFMFMGAFLVKLSVFPFHVWLPKAHVEAPVFGSMLLAGVLLNLGGLGLLRVISLMVNNSSSLFVDTVLVLAVYGGVLMGLICLRQSDLNKLIAYSSVVHISGVLVGLLSGFLVGVSSGVLIIIGHGLCSSFLFYLVGCSSSITGSRLICLNKGGLLVCPSFAALLFLACVSNISCPPTLSFLGEVGVFTVVVWISNWLLLVVSGVGVVTAGYSIVLYVGCCHGSMGFRWHGGCISVMSSLLGVIHLLPLWGGFVLCF